MVMLKQAAVSQTVVMEMFNKKKTKTNKQTNKQENQKKPKQNKQTNKKNNQKQKKQHSYKYC